MKRPASQTAKALTAGSLLCMAAAVLGGPPPAPVARPMVGLTRTEKAICEHATDPGRAVVKVVRTGPTDAPLTVRLRLNPNQGWADNGVDVETIPETVTIPAGALSADIELKVINDDVVEGDEKIELFVLHADDYDLDPKAVMSSVTIRDNDYWRWLPVRGKQLKPTDVAQRKALPAFDGLLQAPATMDLAGSVAATENSVTADLVARFFDGGVFSDTSVQSDASFEMAFDFDPVTGRISRSRYKSRSAVVGIIPAELAHSCVVDNTRSNVHTAEVTVMLAAAARCDLTVTGDDYCEVDRTAGPRPKPLKVVVRKTDPAGDSLGKTTKLVFTLERYEEDRAAVR